LGLLRSFSGFFFCRGEKQSILYVVDYQYNLFIKIYSWFQLLTTAIFDMKTIEMDMFKLHVRKC